MFPIIITHCWKITTRNSEPLVRDSFFYKNIIKCFWMPFCRIRYKHEKETNYFCKWHKLKDWTRFWGRRGVNFCTNRSMEKPTTPGFTSTEHGRVKKKAQIRMIQTKEHLQTLATAPRSTKSPQIFFVLFINTHLPRWRARPFGKRIGTLVSCSTSDNKTIEKS